MPGMTDDVRPTALPPLFLSHGSPMTALEPREAGAFMRQLGERLRERFARPRAVLAVSAHSLAPQLSLSVAERHAAVHDFGGFDPALHTLRYDTPGAPGLAQQVADMLHAAGMPVQLHEAGGLDHGIWTPLRFVWPAADLPVLPMAWPPDAAPERLFAWGRLLAPLAERGVLVMASGSITHNLRRVFAGGLRNVGAPATPESTAFRDWFAARGAAGDWPSLMAYRNEAPHAALMHPTDEHLLPWFVAAGAGGSAAPALRLHASSTYGELGMDAYAFGPQAPRLAEAWGEASGVTPA